MHTGTAQMCAQVIREKEAQLKAEHEQAAIQLRTEHDEQLKQLHALTENAGGAEQAALQQLEQARKECAVLQERLQAAEQVGHCRGCLPAAAGPLFICFLRDSLDLVWHGMTAPKQNSLKCLSALPLLPPPGHLTR